MRIIKILKDAFQAYADFEKAMLQMEMVMAIKKKVLTVTNRKRLEDAKKEDLIDRILYDAEKLEKRSADIEHRCNEVNQLRSEVDGWKVISEVQKRKLAYYKSELADTKEAYLGLCVNLDMGLQK